MEQWSDPEPGSGISKQNLLIAFIPAIAPSRIRDGAMVGSGIRDKTSRIRNTGWKEAVAFGVFLQKERERSCTGNCFANLFGIQFDAFISEQIHVIFPSFPDLNYPKSFSLFSTVHILFFKLFRHLVHLSEF
jgi:hypothetical protein